MDIEEMGLIPPEDIGMGRDKLIEEIMNYQLLSNKLPPEKVKNQIMTLNRCNDNMLAYILMGEKETYRDYLTHTLGWKLN